jgi:hypothetical protein
VFYFGTLVNLNMILIILVLTYPLVYSRKLFGEVRIKLAWVLLRKIVKHIVSLIIGHEGMLSDNLVKMYFQNETNVQ